MQLILDNNGATLEKQENLFALTLGDQVRCISPAKLTAIHIFKPVLVSTAALLLAAEHGIPVLLYDRSYKPAARLWRSNFPGTGQVRERQPLFCQSPAAVYWSKKLIALKLTAQLQHLTKIENRWPAHGDDCRQARETITATLQQVENLGSEPSVIPTLQGLEGVATAASWGLLQKVVQEAPFQKREQQQPADRFNPCINYLYGILYGKVEGALLAYGLDPMVGMMHAEGYSKKSLVYDCIEPFRPWADSLVVELFKKKALQSIHFEYRESEVRLARDGRHLLVAEFIKLLAEKTVLNNRRITRNDQVFFLCSQLAQAVKNFDPHKKQAP